MDISVENIGSRNDHLEETLRDLQTENEFLVEKVNMLEKKLDQEKRFHRKFADEVCVTESTRLEDFRKEKRLIVEANKSLTTENRRLKKDAEFYKKAHEELTKEAACESPKQLKTLPQETPPSSTRSTRSSESRTVEHLQVNCTHKSSKVLSKVNAKLFQDNRKLQLKVGNLNATVAMYKKKNQQLENYKKKIENKKVKFLEDSDVLDGLVKSTQNKNSDTYNSDVLKMLGNLLHK